MITLEVTVFMPTIVTSQLTTQTSVGVGHRTDCVVTGDIALTAFQRRPRVARTRSMEPGGNRTAGQCSDSPRNKAISSEGGAKSGATSNLSDIRRAVEACDTIPDHIRISILTLLSTIDA